MMVFCLVLIGIGRQARPSPGLEVALLDGHCRHSDWVSWMPAMPTRLRRQLWRASGPAWPTPPKMAWRKSLRDRARSNPQAAGVRIGADRSRIGLLIATHDAAPRTRLPGEAHKVCAQAQSARR